jgi:hypothetical protein
MLVGAVYDRAYKALTQGDWFHADGSSANSKTERAVTV